MEEKKPRWEVKYEKFLSEEPIADKIKALKAEKVKGDFKTKEEYENAKSEHENEIKTYENFEKNKDKIKNLLEYRKMLESKLAKLPKDNTEQLATKKQEQAEIEEKINKYQEEIADIKKELKQDMPEENKQILLMTLKIKQDSMGELQDKQGKLDREVSTLEAEGKISDKDADKRAVYERRIAKCNIMAANLLKGKELGDFEVKVTPNDKKFKSPELDKKVKDARKEKEYILDPKTGELIPKDISLEREDEEVGTDLTEVSEFAKKHPRLAKIGNFFKKIANIFKKKDGTVEDRETVEMREKIIEEVQAEKDEDAFLNKVAQKGFKQTLREEYEQNKKEAANAYAEKYGGRYEKQDGATAKKEETPEIEDEELDL